jgi:ABC-2 type transport system ATP-binding protein
MRQRLGVARCLISDPELLILDEPTNGLDPGGIQEFRGLVRSLVDEGRTVVLSSHLLDEVEKICDHAAIVDRGRIVAQGSLAELSASDESTIAIGCSDPNAARAAIDGDVAIKSIEVVADGLQLLLPKDSHGEQVAASVNKRLVEAGIAVHRIEPARVSLEHRFLEITQRLGAEGAA